MDKVKHTPLHSSKNVDKKKKLAKSSASSKDAKPEHVKVEKPKVVKVEKPKVVKADKPKVIKPKVAKADKPKVVKPKVVKKLRKSKKINMYPSLTLPVSPLRARQYFGSMYRSPLALPRLSPIPVSSPFHPRFGHLRSTCASFLRNPSVNPLTHRSIKPEGLVFKKLNKACSK